MTRLTSAFYVLAVVITLALTYSYLYPGSQALIEGRKDILMSDGTDITGSSFIWDALQQVFETHPSHYFYGAIYYPYAEPERGWPFWVSWMERLVGLPLSYWLPIEQTPTAVVVVFMLLNVLAMYAVGRAWEWPRWTAFALAIAWSFTYYTRARAQVHTAFAGTFHIPFIFLGLTLTVQHFSRRSLLAAATCFFIAVMAPHYYVLTAAFLSPFFLIYALLSPETRQNWKRVAIRLTLATLPAVLFLLLNLKFALPSDARINSAAAIPNTGATIGDYHPFLDHFAARPIDYLTGDIGLMHPTADPNPLKHWLNERVWSELSQGQIKGNTHERTNGIRWIVLGLALAAIISAIRGTVRKAVRREIFFFVCLAGFSFLLSLSPEQLGPVAPSLWLYEIVSQVRVPSRAGIWVHFSILAVVGLWLTQSETPNWTKFLKMPLVLTALMVIEMPPFYQTMRMSPIQPPYAALARDKGACGVGFYFPAVSVESAQILYYKYLERMRFTNCFHLNAFVDTHRLVHFMNLFPPVPDYIKGLNNDLLTPVRLERLARCVPLSFIAFDPVTPDSQVVEYCNGLGWTLVESDRLCVSPTKGAPLKAYPQDCL